MHYGGHEKESFDWLATTGKIWSLYSSDGFLLYIRDTIKMTKVTNINQSTIEKYI